MNGGKPLFRECDSGPLCIIFDGTSSFGNAALVAFIGGDQHLQHQTLMVNICHCNICININICNCWLIVIKLKKIWLAFLHAVYIVFVTKVCRHLGDTKFRLGLGLGLVELWSLLGLVE